MIELHGAHTRARTLVVHLKVPGAHRLVRTYTRPVYTYLYCTRTAVVVSLTVCPFGPLLAPPPVIPGEQTAVRPDRLAAKTGRRRMGLKYGNSAKYLMFHRFRLTGSNGEIVRKTRFVT